MGLFRLYWGVLLSVVGIVFFWVLGVIRDIVLVSVLGAFSASDVFWIVFMVPNVFRCFVVDEGLTGVMVLVLIEVESAEGVEVVRRISGGVFIALLLVCSLICVAGVLGALWLVKVFVYGFFDDPVQFVLIVELTWWMFFFVFFVSLVSWCEGVLNIRGHYFISKVALGLVSVGIIVVALFGLGYFE